VWYNPIIVGLLRSPLHWLLSSGIILVGYTGRQSGRARSVPVSYVRDEADENLLWTTSLRKRTWWRNLRGGAPVTLRLRGKNRPATGTAIEDEKGVAEALIRYLRQTPNFAQHFEIAVVDGEPNAEDALRAAQKRVMVRFDLESG
jgi:deazaflavin-dependent oxidoreductase (nitroreductase family)